LARPDLIVAPRLLLALLLRGPLIPLLALLLCGSP
jgi:hypothetical protein